LHLTLATTLLSLALGAAPSTGTVPLGLWVPERGDEMIVDTAENVGYLVHANGDYTSFEVATGQKRVVRYIGRTYDARTPNHAWVAKSLEKKGDHVTYGISGRFLRLYEDDERTAYGIHPYKFEDKMMSENDRFGSMGCIIVREAIMDIVERTFELNGDALPVTTVHGLTHAIAGDAESDHILE
jgi:hypothetical protein